MQTPVRIVLALFALAAINLYLAVNHSSVKTELLCRSQEQELTVTLEQYRWWVGLWSESDASVWIEKPGKEVYFFPDLKLVGHSWLIYDNHIPAGHINTLNREIGLETKHIRFDGICEKAKPL